jgi:DmsE family decaheme c-type cytochrome
LRFLPKWLAGTLAVCLMLFSWQVAGDPAGSAQPESEAVVASPLSKHTRGKTCVACHKTEGGPPTATTHHGQSCEGCHVDSAVGVVARVQAGESIKLPKVAECMSCHKKERKLMNWAFSVHNKAGGVCTDCHVTHAPPVTKTFTLSANKSDRRSATCLKCHQDAGAQFKMRSHHPVTEGGMSCTGCHDPHGSDHTALKSRSDQCLACHQSHRGPKVFEHAPVVEDCMNCHAPHGSPNRALLSVSQPSVCLQCHSVAQGKHGISTEKGPGANSGTRSISGTVLRGCTNCHGAIHGSQQDPLLRY